MFSVATKSAATAKRGDFSLFILMLVHVADHDIPVFI